MAPRPAGKPPYVDRITEARLDHELALAARDGISKGEDLAEYNELMQSRRELAAKGFTKMASSTKDRLKYLYRVRVFPHKKSY
jgi:hypothetical protein